jgi:chaperonin GroEL
VYGKAKEITVEDVGHVKYDFAAGMDVVWQALSVPLRTIADNAGVRGSVVVAKVAESSVVNFGYNALTDTYEDLVKSGVITPAKVDRSALQNASSVATVLLAADCIVTEKPEKKEAGGRA